MVKRPVHPGEVLAEDILAPMGMSAQRLAQALHVPADQISEILTGSRAITDDMARWLERYLGTSADFWLGMQREYDVDADRP